MTLLEQFKEQINDLYREDKLDYSEKIALIEKAELIQKELSGQVSMGKISEEQVGIVYQKALQSLLQETKKMTFEQFKEQISDLYHGDKLDYSAKNALIEKAELIQKELSGQVSMGKISAEQVGIVYQKALQSLLQEAERLAKQRKLRPYKISILCLIIATIATLGVVLPEFRLPMSRLEAILLVVMWPWIGFVLLNYGSSPINPYVPDYAITMGEKEYRERAVGIFVLIWFILLTFIIVFIRGMFLGWNRYWWFTLSGWVLLLFGSLLAIYIMAEQYS